MSCVRRARVAGTLLVLASALILGGCGGGQPTASPNSPAVFASTTTATTTTTVGMPRSVPVSIQIPKLKVRSTLIPLGLDAQGAVQTPSVSTPMQAGWFDGGPTPGEIGPAVILGHVDGNNEPGIFVRLHELVPNDEVLIARADGTTVTFRVTRKQEISKNQFPTDEVYGNTTDAGLRLITCGGSFDRTAHSYRDNVIIFATTA